PDQFFKQLKGAMDGFAMLAEYYGKGSFDTNNPKMPGGDRKRKFELPSISHHIVLII
ncbi:hypothetical protein SARC_12487, partial [Sphaeroforma arctica JP610]